MTTLHFNMMRAIDHTPTSTSGAAPPGRPASAPPPTASPSPPPWRTETKRHRRPKTTAQIAGSMSRHRCGSSAVTPAASPASS